MSKIKRQAGEISLHGNISYKDAKEIRNKINGDITCIDFAKLSSIDYASAILLSKYRAKFKNVSKNVASIFDLIDDKSIDRNLKSRKNELNFIQFFGKNIVDFFRNTLSLSEFLGEFLIKNLKALLNPLNFRFKELSNFIKDGGVNAVFIVLLTSFLIGIVLAYLGSAMLAQFGASIYIVDIMGVLTLREVAPLIAAIVVAGRTASSFTAQIGVMKITEEIDAMKTMGLDPFGFLVIPRVIAMVFALPLVIFLADVISILGQMLVAQNILDIGFNEYLARFKDSIELRHLYIGLFKAPFFGAAIAIIGCMRGFEVSHNAESLGQKTTISVVNAIFCVIAIDAVFAIFFMWYGV
ncbi:hypothetical protein LMG7974_01737 [Campylobacter majalis]|uniref:ABC transporter permease n=1 Tax=Campylobacter majalis TaxID=2790656 RepID=A0ABM8Q9H7_9BACT|nr:ABC transporter permease [Campylobacter majalis]CAD7289660.1 hypothetical protein LMG7974_01737 [Campylobacter majalis]